MGFPALFARIKMIFKIVFFPSVILIWNTEGADRIFLLHSQKLVMYCLISFSQTLSDFPTVTHFTVLNDRM